VPTAFPKPSRSWLWPLVAAAIAFGISAQKLVGGYGDLGIYLDAAREWSAGGVDLYRPREGSGPYLYPHFALAPLALLLHVFGDAGTRWIWCGLMAFATAWLLRSLVRCAAPFGSLRPWQWVVFGVLFQRCIAQNLTHGQLSLLVGAFVAAGIAALAERRPTRAGVWLGAAAALKLTPVLFVLALPFLRQWRAAAVMATTIVALVVVLPWPLCGTEEHLRHLADFWRASTSSLEHGSDAAIVRLHAGPSVAGTFDYLLQPRPFDEQGRTVNLFDVGDGTLRAVKIIWSLGLCALFGAWFLRARGLADGPRLVHQACAVTLAMSVFAPLLRVYHLAAVLPAAMLFCTGPRTSAPPIRRDWLWLTTAGVLLVTMTLRQRNLLGETLWRALDTGGPLHLGLIGLAVWCCRAAKPAPQ
jgi:hypothetical protein